MMKEKDLIVDCPSQQVILYAEKNDGTYGPVQTGSYTTGNHISEHFKITDHLSGALLEKLRAGEISPVYFYMMMESLTIPELAARVRLSRRSVRRHLEPEGFRRLTIDTLKRYADVLNIPVANMFQIIQTVEDKNWNAGFREGSGYADPVRITQKPTANPLVVETELISDPE